MSFSKNAASTGIFPQYKTAQISIKKPCVNNDLQLMDVPGNTVSITWKRNGIHLRTDLLPATATTIAGGERTRASSGFYFPAGIATDREGNIYVADQFNHRIQKWAPGASRGVTVAGGQGEGSSAAQLHYPMGVAIDEQGNLYIADAGNHRVQRWAPGALVGETVAGGNGQGSGSHQLSFPYGVAVDNEGGVYVSDNYNHRIQYWSRGASKGISVAGGNGSGNAIDQLRFPANIKLDQSGRLYIADAGNDRILLIDRRENITRVVAGGNGRGNKDNQLYYPTDMSIDESGDLYVVDQVNQRIQYWEKNAAKASTYLGGKGIGNSMDQFYYPYGITGDATGNLLVIDQYNHRLQSFRNRDLPFSKVFSYTVREPGKYLAVLTNCEGQEFSTNEIAVGNNEKVTISALSTTVCAGSNQILKSNVPCIFTSSDEQIAYIYASNTLVTVRPGKVIIRSLPLDTNTCSIAGEDELVIKPLPELPSIATFRLDNIQHQETAQNSKAQYPSITICAGTQFSFHTGKGLWSVSDTNIVQMQQQGILARKSGNAQLSYYIQENGCEQTLKAEVVVLPAPDQPMITGICRVAAGNFVQLKANISQGVWRSFDGTIAVVNDQGVVTGSKAGNTHIQFQYTDDRGCSAETIVPMMVHPRSPIVRDSVYQLKEQTPFIHAAAQVQASTGMSLKWYKDAAGYVQLDQPLVPAEAGTHILWVSQVENGIPSVKVPCRITIVKAAAPAIPLQVTVMGNPAIQQFNVKLSGSAATPIQLRVLDMQGRVLEQRNGMMAGTTVQFGERYPGGQYLLECVQGKERKVVQLIKAGQSGGAIIAARNNSISFKQ